MLAHVVTSCFGKVVWGPFRCAYEVDVGRCKSWIKQALLCRNVPLVLSSAMRYDKIMFALVLTVAIPKPPYARILEYLVLVYIMCIGGACSAMTQSGPQRVPWIGRCRVRGEGDQAVVPRVSRWQLGETVNYYFLVRLRSCCYVSPVITEELHLLYYCTRKLMPVGKIWIA